MAWSPNRAGASLVLSFFLAATVACGGSSREAKSPGEGGSAGSDSSSSAAVGQQAPDLSIQSLNGKGRVSLRSLSGKLVVVDFWATWCGPCKQSFPKLEELAKRSPGKIEVIGVSVDDQQDGVAQFAKDNGASFPIVWDQGHTVANRWQVASMPTTYILDGSGTVRFIHAGFHDGEADAIAKELASLSGEDSSDKTRTRLATASPASGSPLGAESGVTTSSSSTLTDERTSASSPTETARTKAKKAGSRAKPGSKKPPPKKTKKSPTRMARARSSTAKT